MSNWIYWMIITLIYLLSVIAIHIHHQRIERFQLHMIEGLKLVIRKMGGEITEEQDGKLTIQYHERGDDE